MEINCWFVKLDLIDKISLIGSVASILGIIPIFFYLFKVTIILSPKKVIREFLFIFNIPRNYVLLSILLVSIVLAFILAKGGKLQIFFISCLILTYTLLLISIFFRQSKPLMRDLILSKLQNAIDKYGNICTAAKFDIDLIVAINDYSYAVGNAIYQLVQKTLDKYENELRESGYKIVSVSIPESDEVIWIVPNFTDVDLADISDRIRREVKQSLRKIPYYEEAREFVINKLTSPALTNEEKEGIGTVSVGVAAYSKGVETLLSDISSAMKESKFRGRNRTIIYQREKPSIVRDH